MAFRTNGPPRFTVASAVTEGSESRDRTASVHEDATSRRASGCAASNTIPGTEAFNTSPGASSVPDSAASRFAEASGSPACASPVNAATSRINASGSLNKTDRSPPTFASSKKSPCPVTSPPGTSAISSGTENRAPASVSNNRSEPCSGASCAPCASSPPFPALLSS